MKRSSLPLAMCGAIISLYAPSASACSCIGGPVEEDFETADAVYEGEVLAGGEEVVVLVTRDWKGRRAGAVVVLENPESDCSVLLARGEHRLLFVNRWSIGPLTIDIDTCNRHPLVGSDEYQRVRARLLEITGAWIAP